MIFFGLCHIYKLGRIDILLMCWILENMPFIFSFFLWPSEVSEFPSNRYYTFKFIWIFCCCCEWEWCLCSIIFEVIMIYESYFLQYINSLTYFITKLSYCFCFLVDSLEFPEFNLTIYSHALHNNASVNNGPHLQRWSHKIIMELKNSYHLAHLWWL